MNQTALDGLPGTGGPSERIKYYDYLRAIGHTPSQALRIINRHCPQSTELPDEIVQIFSVMGKAYEASLNGSDYAPEHYEVATAKFLWGDNILSLTPHGFQINTHAVEAAEEAHEIVANEIIDEQSSDGMPRFFIRKRKYDADDFHLSDDFEFPSSPSAAPVTFWKRYTTGLYRAATAAWERSQDRFKKPLSTACWLLAGYLAFRFL